MCRNTRREKMINEDTHDRVGIAYMEEKIRENHFDGLIIYNIDIWITKTKSKIYQRRASQKS